MFWDLREINRSLAVPQGKMQQLIILLPERSWIPFSMPALDSIKRLITGCLRRTSPFFTSRLLSNGDKTVKRNMSGYKWNPM